MILAKRRCDPDLDLDPDPDCGLGPNLDLDLDLDLDKAHADVPNVSMYGLFSFFISFSHIYVCIKN